MFFSQFYQVFINKKNNSKLITNISILIFMFKYSVVGLNQRLIFSLRSVLSL